MQAQGKAGHLVILAEPLVVLLPALGSRINLDPRCLRLRRRVGFDWRRLEVLDLVHLHGGLGQLLLGLHDSIRVSGLVGFAVGALGVGHLHFNSPGDAQHHVLLAVGKVLLQPAILFYDPLGDRDCLVLFAQHPLLLAALIVRELLHLGQLLLDLGRVVFQLVLVQLLRYLGRQGLAVAVVGRRVVIHLDLDLVFLVLDFVGELVFVSHVSLL